VIEGTDSRAYKLVAPHCDIEERLRAVPPSAQLRGLYHRSVINMLKQEGKFDAYREYFPDEHWSAMTLYPVGGYLLRLAVAGAILATPDTLHAGMHQAARLNAITVASSLLGRALIRILAKDPVRLTEQGMAAKRQSTTYGEWKIVARGSRFVETIYRTEYIWLDSAIAGSAAGTFEACKINATVQTTLTDRFNGSALVSW
jgi:uncharacterized protein (TIGR02265 family)